MLIKISCDVKLVNRMREVTQQLLEQGFAMLSDERVHVTWVVTIRDSDLTYLTLKYSDLYVEKFAD